MTKTFIFDSISAVNELTSDQILEIAESFTNDPYGIVISPPGKEEFQKVFSEYTERANKFDNEFEKIAFAFRDRVREILHETSDEYTADDTLAKIMQEFISDMILPEDNLCYTSYDGWGDNHPDAYWVPSTC